MIKVLHVEDDPDIREIAEMALSMSGRFELVQCASGPEAIERVATFLPDLILLDMMMPGMTGCQVLEHFRQVPALSQTPAVFMTARAQHTEIEELLAFGAADVISKPFDPMTLSDQLSAVLDRI
ncbi:MAG: response regulator [Loktanella sp.]|nr:response regulator [Loktanella sp.]